MKPSLLKIGALVGLLVVIKPCEASGLFDFSAGVNYWNSDSKASYGVAKDSLIDLNFEKQGDAEIEFSVDHSIPLVPNARYRLRSSSFGDSTSLNQTYTLGGEAFSIASSLDAKHEVLTNDLLLHYSLIDMSILTINMGVLTRYQSADILVQKINDVQIADQKVSKWVPMVNVSVKSSVPLLGFFAFADLSYGEDNYLYESGLGYNFDEGLFPEIDVLIGYRKEKLEFGKDEGLVFEQDLSTLYSGIKVRF